MGGGLLATEQPGAAQPQLIDPLLTCNQRRLVLLELRQEPLLERPALSAMRVDLCNFILTVAALIGQSAIGRGLVRQSGQDAVGITIEIELAQSERLDQRLELAIDRGDAVAQATIALVGDGRGLLELAEAAGKGGAILGQTRELALETLGRLDQLVAFLAQCARRLEPLAARRPTLVYHRDQRLGRLWIGLGGG